MIMNEVLRRFQEEMDVQTDGTFRVEPTFATVLFEDRKCWILLYTEDGTKAINVIYKDQNRVMDTLEVA